MLKFCFLSPLRSIICTCMFCAVFFPRIIPFFLSFLFIYGLGAGVLRLMVFGDCGVGPSGLFGVGSVFIDIKD